MKEVNEEIFHIFGYADMSEEKEYLDIPNNTPYMDFNGKASPQSKAKFNYYKELNKAAMKKRLKLKHGDLQKDELKIKIDITNKKDGAYSCISELNIFQLENILAHASYDNAE